MTSNPVPLSSNSHKQFGLRRRQISIKQCDVETHQPLGHSVIYRLLFVLGLVLLAAAAEENEGLKCLSPSIASG